MTKESPTPSERAEFEADLLPYEIEAMARTMHLHGPFAEVVRQALLDGIEIGRASVSEDAARLAVIDAAVKWWEGSRPMAWDEAEHLRHPEVNQPSASEKNLASAVAAARKP